MFQGFSYRPSHILLLLKLPDSCGVNLPPTVVTGVEGNLLFFLLKPQRILSLTPLLIHICCLGHWGAGASQNMSTGQGKLTWHPASLRTLLSCSRRQADGREGSLLSCGPALPQGSSLAACLPASASRERELFLKRNLCLIRLQRKGAPTSLPDSPGAQDGNPQGRNAVQITRTRCGNTI